METGILGSSGSTEARSVEVGLAGVPAWTARRVDGETLAQLRRYAADFSRASAKVVAVGEVRVRQSLTDLIARLPDEMGEAERRLWRIELGSIEDGRPWDQVSVQQVRAKGLYAVITSARREGVVGAFKAWAIAAALGDMSPVVYLGYDKYAKSFCFYADRVLPRPFVPQRVIAGAGRILDARVKAQRKDTKEAKPAAEFVGLEDLVI